MAKSSLKPAVASDGVVWITGGSSGIGAQLAREYADRGWTVAITARNHEALEAVAHHSDKIHIYPGDVTDRPRMAEIVKSIEADLSPIALAILNAGIYLPTALPKFDASVFDKSFAVNLTGTINGLAPIIPSMLSRGHGQIALVASVAGFGGLPTSAAYGATKAALLNMGEALAMELAAFGVSVHVVAPGFVETPATDRNRFAMPFLQAVDVAARRICDGLARGGFFIVFPRRFALILRLLNLLPRNLYVRLFRSVLRRGTSNPEKQD